MDALRPVVAVIIVIIILVIAVAARSPAAQSSEKEKLAFGRHRTHWNEPYDYYGRGFGGLRRRHRPKCRLDPWDSWCWCECPAGNFNTTGRLCRCPCV